MPIHNDDTVPSRDTEAVTEASATELGGRRISRYELGEVASRTEHALVHRAYDPELRRDVVVHILKLQGNDRELRVLEAARVFAKVRDPSLVPIFDVGLSDRQVYLVMQQVGGCTMSEWLGSGAPTWRDIVRPFLRAARGLHAAHIAGITHGDLSSDSIVVDGRDVFVTGFTFSVDDQPSGDAEADQKALRNALGKALHKRTPPTWVVMAIEKSWPDLKTFADHVETRLSGRTRKFVVASVATLVGMGAVASFLLLGRAERNPCPDPSARLVRVWNDGLRAQLEAGFKTAAPAIAAGTVARVLPSLDAYAKRWRSTQLEACQATYTKRTQPPELFDRRRACLERRLEAFGALVTTLTQQPAARIVVQAEEAFASLPDIGDCERAEQLMAMPPRPTDPTLQARIDEAERELDEIGALRIRGENKAGLERARKAVENGRALGYAPVLARALAHRARLEEDARLESAEATLRELAQVAADARTDELAALAWVRLMNHLAASRGRPAEANALEPVAEAAVMRAGATPDLLFEFHLAAGGSQMVADNLEAAEKHLGAAQAIASDDRKLAHVALFRAKVMSLKKGPTVGVPLGKEALALAEKALGPNHPFAASVLDLLSQVQTVAGNFDDAESYARRQIAIIEGVYGTHHAELSAPLRVLTHIATMRGKHDDARELARRVLEIAERGADPHQLGSAHSALAQALAMSDGFASAKPHYLKGLELMEQVRGKDHQTYIRLENDYAAKLAMNGSCVEAEPLLAHSIGFFETKRPELTALPRYHRANCAAAAGRTAEAIADFERALADCQKASCEPAIALSAVGALGELLVRTRRDRVRGAALLNEARAGFEAKGMKDHVDETDRMMKAVGVKPR